MENPQGEQKKKAEHKPGMSWHHRKKVITKNIPVELDLEKREIYFKEGTGDIPVRFASNNIDSFLSNHVDPKDLNNVVESLSQAKQGVEKPIRFNFVHPHVPMPVQYEYHYQIVYVKYSQTRLQGVLVKAKTCRKKN